MNIKIFSYFFLLASVASAENIESLVRKNQKAAIPEFLAGHTAEFSSLQKAALNGDVSAQEKIPSLLTAHLRSVYGILNKQGGLLFSVCRPVRGYDEAAKNYAVNIAEFFEATTDDIRVAKSDFEVTAKDGAVYQIGLLKYKTDGAMIEVKKNSRAQWIALADLCDKDRRFVENALADEAFESSGDFEIFGSDSRNEEGENKDRDKVSYKSSSTGEKVEGAFASASTKGIARRIILENKGNFPIKNLMVEYQSFAEQTIMKRPKDFPSDYCCAGFAEVPFIAPKEKKELVLKLPDVVNAKQETIHAGDYEYSLVLPPDVNWRSEGRMNGIRVRVHRFTPYGERLTRAYESAGTPSTEWINVAPTGVDIR